jgi:hypothetical protein
MAEIEPHMALIINLFLAKGEQQKSAESPPTWRYTLHSVAVI